MGSVRILLLAVVPAALAQRAMLTDAVDALEARIAALEARLAPPDPCDSQLLDLSGALAWTYSGCNRNVHRNTTQSVETCQNGTVAVYNVSKHLFDIKISHPPDAWHFVCGTAVDRPKVATCTLTYEEPARPEGPAWVEIRFDDVNFDGEKCAPSKATIVGTYFYDYLTSDAGVYIFDAVVAAQ